MLALLAAMQAVEAGDFSVSLPVHWPGVEGKVAEAFNSIVQLNRRLAEDLQRVGVKVGREGQTRQRLTAANRQGAWAGMERSDRKSTRLNSSHSQISYAVFCLKKKKNTPL